MMKRISLSETAHDIVRSHLNKGDMAIDATLGNGHDTVFLAQCVGETGRVYGFDIQAKALESTRLRLLERGLLDRVTLFHTSHADLSNYVSARVGAIMFNLGYLPGADKNIMTQAGSTLLALNQACRLLRERGVMTVTAYPGHKGGDEETALVDGWMQQLDPKQFHGDIIFSQYHQLTAPRLFVIRKLL